MQTPSAIGVAGRVGSGKSSLSTLLSEQSGWPIVRFGDFLRGVAEQRGLPTDRQSLQQLGIEYIGRGWGPFCSEVLESAGWRPGTSVIFDGIRHAEAVQALNELLSPGRLFVVLLAADDGMVQTRLRLRDGEGTDLRRIESHPSDDRVADRLHSVTDMVLDAALSLPTLAERVWRLHGIRTRYRGELPRWLRNVAGPSGVDSTNLASSA